MMQSPPAQPSQPTKPLVVKIVDSPNSELKGLSDVLLGSLGLTGILVLGALLAALVFGSVLFWIRSRSEP
jgi:hypothetical protein